MKKLFLITLCLLTNIIVIGQNWQLCTPIITSSRLNSVYFVDNNTGFSIGYNGTILKTKDIGETWEKIAIGTSKCLSSICFSTDSIGIIVGDSGLILRTSNLGDTWSVISSSTNTNLNSICFVNDSIGFMVGDNGLLMKSNDYGLNWNIINLNISQKLTTVDFTDEPNGYISTSSGYIYKTTNNGNNWALINFDPIYFIIRSINFCNKNVGYSINEYSVYKTIDEGQNWVLLNIPNSCISTSFFKSSYFLNPDTGWVVGNCYMQGLILNTKNGGLTWNHYLTNVNEGLSSVYFINNNIGFAVGQAGKIFKYKNNTTNIITDSFELSETHLKITNNNLIINLPSHNESNIVEIYNIYGQKILQKTLSQAYNEIDIIDLKNGIYIAKISNNYNKVSLKFIKL